MALIHVSIVSHRQASLVTDLLSDLARFVPQSDLRVTVLSNLPEPRPATPQSLAGRIEFLLNERPAGFAANHNRVFRGCDSPYFCVLNPDLRISENPFPALLDAFGEDSVSTAAPAAYGPDGTLQDSARALPSPLRIASKVFRPVRGPDYALKDRVTYPDWVAGLFMLFRTAAFRAAGGFDERYFLYYEDVDLCSRLRLAGWQIAWLPGVRVTHDARRHSHRDLRHFLWHLSSVTRFFLSDVYRRARLIRRTTA